jgi:hypothetical protein
MRNQILSIVVKAIRAQSNALKDIINLATSLVMPDDVVYKKSMSGLLTMTGLGSARRISGSALKIVFIS